RIEGDQRRVHRRRAVGQRIAAGVLDAVVGKVDGAVVQVGLAVVDDVRRVDLAGLVEDAVRPGDDVPGQRQLGVGAQGEHRRAVQPDRQRAGEVEVAAGAFDVDAARGVGPGAADIAVGGGDESAGQDGELPGGLVADGQVAGQVQHGGGADDRDDAVAARTGAKVEAAGGHGGALGERERAEAGVADDEGAADLPVRARA